uniref:G-protein coupled receptors family 1 profile domain-containing protein n=1 Tax=Ditylenchus dipsaci TaxID=166011 RepID=A0A915CWZ4_9BILA
MTLAWRVWRLHRTSAKNSITKFLLQQHLNMNVCRTASLDSGYSAPPFCKLHHVCGSVGRIVSTFLITAMSFDRFVAVCHPYKTYYRFAFISLHSKFHVRIADVFANK